MASVIRQPFAPLDHARLQGLTSMKNRQNALAPKVTSKRKATDVPDINDFENIDPLQFAKRAKPTPSSKVSFRPTFYLPPTTTSVQPQTSPVATPVNNTVRLRTILHPKPPSSKLTSRSTFSRPAGRSPTRGKRSGLFSTRQRSSPYSRIDPPAFGLGRDAAPFSLDAALKGTIPSYQPKAPSISSISRPSDNSFPAHSEQDMKASWFFDIHEDTPEQEITNMLQHGTCVLDISSDEESATRASREKAEGRDKENIPPSDDISQMSLRRASASRADMLLSEKERIALGDLNAEDYYADGCDGSSVFIVPGDDEHEGESKVEQKAVSEPIANAPTVEDMMGGTDMGTKAALLQPMDGTGESFELWESGSARDDCDTTSAAAQ